MRTPGAVGKENVEKLQRIYDVVKRTPGVTAGYVARQIGLPGSNIYNVLPSLEVIGLYLSEDDRGRLYPVEN